MTAVPKKKYYSEAEYLALERAAEYKSEFYDGEIFAMAGASLPYNRVKENLAGEIGSRLKGTRCQSLSSDMRVKIPKARAYCYPDIVIVCGEPKLEDKTHDTLLNPAVIIEVLSPSTKAFDYSGKFRRYQKLESLKEYVLVAQDECHCDRYQRRPNKTWLLKTFDEIDEDFTLTSVPLRIPMADIYRGITLVSPRPIGLRDHSEGA
ncbi:MAG TPA: Uma2 family endonuclease [Urbifossiella sp.]|nr:Uma2 family endonuclease [Urbifossiella sp.]